MPFDYSTLVAITLQALYDSSSWEEFAQVLADVESAAASHTALSPTRLATVKAMLQRPLYITKRGLPANYENLVEVVPRCRVRRQRQSDSYAAFSAAADNATGYFGRIWGWTASICAIWTARDDDRYLGPFDRVTANPVLVVGNRFDPATPYAGAIKVASLLPGSRLLTVNGWGHTSLSLGVRRQRRERLPPHLGPAAGRTV